jgi:hypothetical protein
VLLEKKPRFRSGEKTPLRLEIRTLHLLRSVNEALQSLSRLTIREERATRKPGLCAFRPFLFCLAKSRNRGFTLAPLFFASLLGLLAGFSRADNRGTDEGSGQRRAPQHQETASSKCCVTCVANLNVEYRLAHESPLHDLDPGPSERGLGGAL